MADDRRYKDDEVRAIIDRALKTQPDAGVTHEDLLAIGAGVGLSSADLENAAREVQEARLNDVALQSVLRRRRRGVAAHAFVFFAVNAGLFLINFLTTPGQWWVLFPIVVWGFALALHAGFALSRGVSPARLNREQRRLQRRQQAGGAALAGNAQPLRGVRIAEAGSAEGLGSADSPEDAASTEDPQAPSTRPAERG